MNHSIEMVLLKKERQRGGKREKAERERETVINYLEMNR